MVLFRFGNAPQKVSSKTILTQATGREGAHTRYGKKSETKRGTKAVKNELRAGGDHAGGIEIMPGVEESEKE